MLDSRDSWSVYWLLQFVEYDGGCMQDRFGRTIDYLRLSVTDLCDYRCLYCMPAHGVEKKRHEDMLTVEECIEVARAAVSLGITKIRLTGGEPLVRKGIVDIVRGIRSISGLKELDLTTNGSLLPALAAPLKDAGLDRLNISLDTLDPEKFKTITRCGRLDDVLSGIKAAHEAGFTGIKFDTVLIGGFNTDEIGDIANLSMDHDWSMRFIELMPMGPCASWPKERFVPASVVLQALPELEEIKSQGVSRLYRLPGAKGTVGLIRPLSQEFCPTCRRIRVTADGMAKGCLHAPDEIRLKGLKGEALVEALRRAILSKPERHHLESGPSLSGRTMNEIGG